MDMNVRITDMNMSAIRVSDIDICKMENAPRLNKINNGIHYFLENGMFKSTIVLTSDKLLISGYTSYLVARLLGIKEVEYCTGEIGEMNRQQELEEIYINIREKLGKRSGSKSMYKNARIILYKKYGRCNDCGRPLQITNTKEDDFLTIDHIVPKALGGKNNIDNFQPLCKDCNTKKDCKIEKDIYVSYALNNHIFNSLNELMQTINVLQKNQICY